LANLFWIVDPLGRLILAFPWYYYSRGGLLALGSILVELLREDKGDPARFTFDAANYWFSLSLVIAADTILPAPP